MSQTLFLILATSMWTIGLYLASEPDEILHTVRKITTLVLGDYWSSPVLSCPYCMPSLHGFFICLVFHYYMGFHIAWYWYGMQWVFVAASSSALNYVLYNLIRILKGYANLFDNEVNAEK